MIKIKPYIESYQQQVIDLIVDIQSQEFGVSITAEDQPDLKDIINYYQNRNGGFWIALDGDNVLGTIAMVDIGNQQVALRKMFVKVGYRGKPLSIGQKLMDKLLFNCQEKNIKAVYLGTVPNYFAAHRFYEKNGFNRIDKTDLPKDFHIMEVDKYFYYKILV